MEVSGFVYLFFDMIQKIIDTVSSFTFKFAGIIVNPFNLAVAMIIIYMVVYGYWKGSRA